MARTVAVHFWATQEAGWMETECELRLGNGQAGDVMQPGVCVPYCDPTGEVGPTCDGTCVQCSGDNRGLCVQGCSGDGCSVDAFC